MKISISSPYQRLISPMPMSYSPCQRLISPCRCLIISPCQRLISSMPMSYYSSCQRLVRSLHLWLVGNAHCNFSAKRPPHLTSHRPQSYISARLLSNPLPLLHSFILSFVHSFIPSFHLELPYLAPMLLFLIITYRHQHHIPSILKQVTAILPFLYLLHGGID